MKNLWVIFLLLALHGCRDDGGAVIRELSEENSERAWFATSNYTKSSVVVPTNLKLPQFSRTANNRFVGFEDTRRMMTFELNTSTNAWELLGNKHQFLPDHIVFGSTKLADNVVVLCQNDVSGGGTFKFQRYTFNGTDWNPSGSSKSLASERDRVVGIGTARVALLGVRQGGSLILFLETYDFDGANWAKVGNTLTILNGTALQVSTGLPEMAAIQSNKVVILYGQNTAAKIATFAFDGTNWAVSGTTTTISDVATNNDRNVNSIASDWTIANDVEQTTVHVLYANSITNKFSVTGNVKKFERISGAWVENTTDSPLNLVSGATNIMAFPDGILTNYNTAGDFYEFINSDFNTSYNNANLLTQNNPVIIAELESDFVIDGYKTGADWDAVNAFSVSESVSSGDLDSTSRPGQLILLDGQDAATQSQTTDNADVTLLVQTNGVNTTLTVAWQSFVFTGVTSVLDEITARVNWTVDPAPYVNFTLLVSVHSAKTDASNLTGTRGAVVNSASFDGDLTVSFYDTNTILSDGVTYWLRFSIFTLATLFSGRTATAKLAYNTAGGYAGGQLDTTGTSVASNIGDAYFSVSIRGKEGVLSLYPVSDEFITPTIDLGTAPGATYEKTFLVSAQSLEFIDIEIASSATGVLTGANKYFDDETILTTPVGGWRDGSILTGNVRYWKISGIIYSFNSRTQTPAVNSVGISARQWASLGTTPIRRTDRTSYIVYPHETTAFNVSSFGDSIDFFGQSTISQVSINAVWNDFWRTFISGVQLQGRKIQYFLAFTQQSKTDWKLPAGDALLIYTGRVEDYSVSSDKRISISTQDRKIEFEGMIPTVWESESDNVTLTGHPIDVLIQILLSYSSVSFDSLDTDSFNTAKSVLTDWQVSRLFRDKPYEIKKAVEELRLIIQGIFLPRRDGRIGIKIYDSTEASVFDFTETNILSLQWEANSGQLINRVVVYGDWDGQGDDLQNYGSVIVAADLTSQTDNQKTVTYEHRDKYSAAIKLPITTAVAGTDTITVAYVPDFVSVGSWFRILDSTANDGYYKVESKTATTVTTVEDLPDSTADGDAIFSIDGNFAANILSRYSTAPVIVNLTTSRREIAPETGDMCTITHESLPASLSGQKFQITAKRFNYDGSTINYTLQRA